MAVIIFDNDACRVVVVVRIEEGVSDVGRARFPVRIIIHYAKFVCEASGRNGDDAFTGQNLLLIVLIAVSEAEGICGAGNAVQHALAKPCVYIRCVDVFHRYQHILLFLVQGGEQDADGVPVPIRLCIVFEIMYFKTLCVMAPHKEGDDCQK